MALVSVLLETAIVAEDAVVDNGTVTDVVDISTCIGRVADVTA